MDNIRNSLEDAKEELKDAVTGKEETAPSAELNDLTAGKDEDQQVPPPENIDAAEILDPDETETPGPQKLSAEPTEPKMVSDSSPGQQESPETKTDNFQDLGTQENETDHGTGDFKELEDKISRLNEEVESDESSIESEIDGLTSRLSDVEQDVQKAATSSRLEDLSSRIDDVEQGSVSEARLEKLEERIDSVEDHAEQNTVYVDDGVDERLTELEETLSSRMEEFDKRLGSREESLQEEFEALRSRIESVEDEMSQQDNSQVENDLEAMRSQVDGLSSRMDSNERELQRLMRAVTDLSEAVKKTV